MIVEVTSSRFGGLVNPYTGEGIVVKMTVPKTGVPKFFAPDTYSPGIPFVTAKDACDAVQRRGGKRIVPNGVPSCAYTGEPLEIQNVEGLGWFYVGGFDPRVPRSAEEFLYYATMRDGVSDRPKPAADESRVGYVEPEFDAPVTTDEPERTEEAHQIAKGVVDQFKDKVGMKNERTVVSMSKGRKGRK